MSDSLKVTQAAVKLKVPRNVETESIFHGGYRPIDVNINFAKNFLISHDKLVQVSISWSSNIFLVH